MFGAVDVRGDLAAMLDAVYRAWPETTHRARWGTRRTNTLRAARENVHRHYDLGNDFYRLWLDRDLLYTCAYFPTPELSLEDAQRAKMDLICRKIWLRPRERVIEAGCGWGALALHMARHYGVSVQAFNLSAEQLSWARDRAQREGLAAQVEFVEDDYRNVSGECDAFVSIGMLEHVGRRSFDALAAVLRRTVKRSGGRGLLHFIGRDLPRPLNPWIRRRIFPGAYTPTLAEVTARIVGPAGMSVVDVENLRMHYARTLADWSERFAAAGDGVRATCSDEFCRTWELYLAGAEAAFRTGWMQLFQIVFAPRESAPPFATRAEIYSGLAART